jgi:hypothetical protein
MKLSPDELKLFHRLHSNLMQYALGKAAETVREQRDQGAVIAARDSLFRNPRRITTFVKNNPYDFTSEELEIVSDWKKARLGTFYIARSLKSHSLFIESTPQYQPTGRIFAVVDLGVPFKKIVQTPLPVVVHALLLPFKGRIVFDGVMTFYQVDLGSDVRELLDEFCDIAIRRSEVITSIDGLKKRKTQT